MLKETSLTVKICGWITKYSIYVLVFLMPILFLPWTSEVLDFNKQALLICLAFISFFSWMLKVLISGEFKVNINKVHIFLIILFLAYLLSTVFSIDRYGSFWGWPRVTSDSLLSVIGLVIFYFVASNVFSKKEITASVYIFSVSALIAEIFGVLQFFGLFIVPLGFTKNVAFNTIGSAGGLGIFAATLLPLTIVLLISARKWSKLLFAAEIFFSAAILLLINFSMVWWTVVFGTALLMICGLFKRDLFDGRWMALPMFFMAVSLFFIILNPQINWLPQKINEVSLSKDANFQIDIQIFKEKPVFGSGPGTFSYNFSKFKSPDFSKTALWEAVFNNGNSKIMTSLATVGGFGILAFLALSAAIIFYAGKFLFVNKNDSGQDIFYSILGLGLFISLVTEIASYFLHNSNLSLDFLLFFLMAVLVGLIFGERKEYDLKPSSLLTLFVTFTFTLVFIFGLGLLILGGQRYAAEVSYYNSLNALQSGRLDDGIKNLENAASANSNVDLYFRQLSQVYLLKAQDVLSDKSKSQGDKTNTIQVLVSNSINAAKIATDLNSKTAGNWLVRGYIYQNLNGLISDSSTWAINSYNEALKLDPNNPYSLTQLGVIYYQNKDYQNAKTNLDQALNLKPDYSNGLYFSGLVFDQLGQKAKAIEQFTVLSKLNPASSIDIQKIIDNLTAGNGALDGLVQQTPTPETPETLAPNQNTNLQTIPKTEAQPIKK